MKRLVFVLALVGLAAPAAGQQTPQARGPGSAWLGVTYDLRWIQSGAGCTSRVVLEGVVPGSPAERAGLRTGDAIVAIDGDSVPARRLPLLSARLAPGDAVRLVIERDGSTRTVTAVADRRPDRPPAIALAPPHERGEAPIIRIQGDSLVATNVPVALTRPRALQGYWLAAADGRTVFRALPARPRSDLDRRVVDLMGCVGEVGHTLQVVARADLERVQVRAESLRVVMARRMLDARDAEARALTLRELAPGIDAPPYPPGGTIIFRSREAARLRNLAGADLVVMEPELAEYFRGVRGGLLVLRVAPGTAAEQGGLRPGDVVTSAGGRPVGTVEDLAALSIVPGRTLDLSVVRQGRVRTLTVPWQP